MNGGNFEAFATFDGIKALILPLMPVLLIYEFLVGFLKKKPDLPVYRVIFIAYVVNVLIGRVLSIGSTEP